MRLVQTLALCCIFACGAMAQRGGGGHGGGGGGGHMGGGGFGGGGHIGGGGFGGGGHIGGFGGGGFVGGGVAGGGFRGGYGGYGYGRGYGYGYGYGRGFYGGYYGYPYWGWGLGYDYWPYYDWGYNYYPYYGYPYYDGTYSTGYSYPAYQTSPNVTVVYPQQNGPAVYQDQTPRPGIHEYDQYGQEIPQAGTGTAPASPPIYLIAFRDQSIRAAAAYWVDGQTLHYVTLEHEEKQAPLSTVDRDLSLRLNRERHVQFQLPQ